MEIDSPSINLWAVFDFLEYNDIVNLSLTNKYFYTKLNPENNSFINSKYRDHGLQMYYNINNINNFKLHDKLYFDDYKKSNNNWGEMNKEIFINLKQYPLKEIGREIYKSFKFHTYFPYERKGNKVLEYKNNTLHQLISYDGIKNELITNNYYSKFFGDKEYSSKNEIEPLKKGLFFQEELVNFKKEEKNYENKKLINYIKNYSYKKIDNVYYSIFRSKNKKEKKKKYKINSVLLFIVWLNHTFILFINLLYHYVNQFNSFGDSKKIIIEYNTTHTNLINFGLIVDEQFNNVNIIFDLLERGYYSSNNNFKIYSMFINIMKNNFYLKLKPILNINIGKIFNLFYEENINKDLIDYDENNIENRETINEENEKENDSDDYTNESFFDDCDMEIDEECNNENKSTYKEAIEEFSNSILDFSINKDNANYINHSKIKLEEYYIQHENLLIEKLIENFQKEINKFESDTFNDVLDSLNRCFPLIKRMFSENDGLKLINRTKLNMEKNLEIFFFEFFGKTIGKQIKQDLIDKISPIYLQANKENFILKDYNFNNKYNKIEYELYTNKVYEMKEALVKNYLNILDDKAKDKINNIVDIGNTEGSSYIISIILL